MNRNRNIELSEEMKERSYTLHPKKTYLDVKRDKHCICGDCHGFQRIKEKTVRLHGMGIVVIDEGKCTDEHYKGVVVSEDDKACAFYLE